LLSALFVLATPFFGFTLTPPTPSALSLPVLAQLDETVEAPDQPASEAEHAEAEPSEAEPSEAEPSGAEPSGAEPAAAGPTALPAVEACAEEGEAPAQDDAELGQLAAQIRQRQELGVIHRAFGIATWASMLVTVGLGLIQYYNLYGFFGSQADNPCVNGNAVFGQDQCFGAPWPHRIAAITTTALYSTSFVLSFALPDPLGASQGPAGADLELHKTLRWVHLGGMIAQVLLGFMVGQNWFGLDRANHFDELQAIATVHQVVGLTTFGVLTAAGAIMIF
jgi:hypothetical protein